MLFKFLGKNVIKKVKKIKYFKLGKFIKVWYNQINIKLVLEDKKIVSDETTTHIIMKQKENSTINGENNVFYAIVDKSELKENVDVIIQK